MNKSKSDNSGLDRRCGEDRRTLLSPGLSDLEQRDGSERRELIDRRQQTKRSANDEKRLGSSLLRYMINKGIKADCKQDEKLHLKWKKK